jgi:starvation-inducible DNA-binding protein
MNARFYSLHLFLEKEYRNLGEAIDEIAERIRILGERPADTLKQFLRTTSLKESHKKLSTEEMILELLKDHETICIFLRDRIALTTELRDEGTADLLIQRLRVHEKSVWMLRSQVPPIVD